MSDTKPQAEPTMEEILASIRKIISEDSPSGAAAPEPAAAPSIAPKPAAPAPGAGVLDLTNEVKDDGTVVPVTAAPPPPPPAPKPVAQPMPAPPPAAAQQVELDDGGLVSTPVANVAAQSFANLVNSVGASRGMPLGNSAQTLEDLTKDLLRPMLKQWLDANLANIVQRVVEREVAKLALRADNDHLR